jgi:hypothetical protein
MSCQTSRRIYRACVGNDRTMHRPLWEPSSLHVHPSPQPVWVPRAAPPSSYLPPDRLLNESAHRYGCWNWYTEREWRIVSAAARMILDDVRRHNDPFPSSLWVLRYPLSGINDPYGVVAQGLLRWSQSVDIPMHIADPLAHLIAHAWNHPAMTSDLIGWCREMLSESNRFEHPYWGLLAAHVVGHGACHPRIGELIPDDLLTETLAFGTWFGYESNQHRRACGPVIRSLITHLFHRQPVSEWIRKSAPGSPQPNLLAHALAAMDPTEPLPDHLMAILLRLLQTHLSDDVIAMAVRRMWDPRCVHLVEAMLTALLRGSRRASTVLDILSHMPSPHVIVSLLRWVDTILTSCIPNDREREKAIELLGYWAGDIGMAEPIMDRITVFLNRVTNPERWIPVVSRSYPILANAAPVLAPKVLDTIMEHCRTFYRQAPANLGATLGALLDVGPPHVAQRALTICREHIASLPWARGNLLPALCRGLSGPCADDVAAVLRTIAATNADAVIDALVTVPSVCDRNGYQIAFGTELLTTYADRIRLAQNGRDVCAWILTHLPPDTARNVLATMIREEEENTSPSVVRYAIIALLLIGTAQQQHEAWNLGRSLLDSSSAMLDACLWGISIAPPDRSIWLMSLLNHRLDGTTGT